VSSGGSLSSALSSGRWLSSPSVEVSKPQVESALSALPITTSGNPPLVQAKVRTMSMVVSSDHFGRTQHTPQLQHAQMT
jgi:hypothetical protein